MWVKILLSLIQFLVQHNFYIKWMRCINPAAAWMECTDYLPSNSVTSMFCGESHQCTALTGQRGWKIASSATGYVYHTEMQFISDLCCICVATMSAQWLHLCLLLIRNKSVLHASEPQWAGAVCVHVWESVCVCMWCLFKCIKYCSAVQEHSEDQWSNSWFTDENWPENNPFKYVLFCIF